MGTYIQTGNVFFRAFIDNTETLARLIEERLQAALGYTVTTVVLTLEEFRAAVEAAPFTDHPQSARPCIVYLSRPLPPGSQLVCPNGTWELLGGGPHVAYVVTQILDGRPGNPDAALTRAAGGHVTTRFYPTSQKLLAAAEQFFHTAGNGHAAPEAT